MGKTQNEEETKGKEKEKRCEEKATQGKEREKKRKESRG